MHCDRASGAVGMAARANPRCFPLFAHLAVGIFGAAYTYPHFVDGTLVLRHAGRQVVSIAAGEIANITLSRGYSHERYAIDEDTLILGNGNGSNVHIELASPLLVPAPKWPWQKEQLSHVNHVQVWFDAPSEAITAISRSA